MKKVLLSLSIMLAAVGFSVAQDNPNAPDFKFETEVHDFGSIDEGTQATFEFAFTNTGKEPLVITNVQASCGCTTPKWSKEPIKPGEKGVISAVYNSTGRPGAFNKQITITSNAKTTPKLIYIKGVVKPKTTEGLEISKPTGPTSKP
jgi:hypothetical protein